MKRSQTNVTLKAEPALLAQYVKKGDILTQEKLKGKFQPLPRFYMGS